jgi:Peptidase family M23
MLAAHPKFTVQHVRGWPLFLLGMLLAIWTLVPVASPAAVAERSVPPPPTAPDPPPVPALWMPVAGAVVRGFDARAGPYGPGHRGIDIAASVGELVRAPTTGRVVFAGPVAGTNWVSLLVAPEVVVTLGPLLDRPIAAEGEQVRRRAPVGRVAPGHPPPPVGPPPVSPPPVGPPPVGQGGPGRAGPSAGRIGSGGGATLHLSVRVNGVYVDPLAYLVDRPRPRLAPLLAPGGLPGG